jgi:broad specificity phosphatase PhoE
VSSHAPLPTIYLARHAETAWSLTGQHTGLTDIPLTPRGEHHAALLGKRLAGIKVEQVFTSPLQRAHRTAEIAGFPAATVDADLVEWDYGEYEGMKTVDIQKKVPHWNLFKDGCPGGETFAQITARVDRMIAKIRKVKGDVLLFSSGHLIRVLTARWLGRPIDLGGALYINAASLSIVSYDHDLSESVLRLWNDIHHLSEGA